MAIEVHFSSKIGKNIERFCNIVASEFKKNILKICSLLRAYLTKIIINLLYQKY